MDATAKYLCTMKLIDDTINPEAAGKSAPESFSATFFAKTAAELPQPTKAGSIIRIHRGQTKKFKETTQLNCDVNIKGAWVLFDPKDGVTPVATSGKRFTFTAEDKSLLNSVRDFAKKYFGKHELTGVTLTDAAKSKPKDFDTICFVLDIKKKEKMQRVRLCDADKIVKLDIPLARQITFSPHEVVRLRSANYFNDGSFKYLTLSEFSNILRVPENYRSAKLLLERIKGAKASEDVRAQVAIYTPHMGAPLVATKILNTHKQNTPTQLKDIFYGDGLKGQKYFRLRGNVVEICPKDPKEWICVVDKKTQKQYKLDDVLVKGKKGKMELPKGMEYYYKLQLFVKDRSVTSDNNLYIIFLCTLEGKGAEFFGVKLDQEGPTEAVLKELKRVYKTLTRPWAVMDFMVEAVEVASKQPVFFLVDTALTI